jgi:hypothetical protein
MRKLSSILVFQLEKVKLKRIKIYSLIDDFVSVFKRVQNLPMFTWVPKLVDGYDRNCLNIDESGKSVDLSKRLTMI